MNERNAAYRARALGDRIAVAESYGHHQELGRNQALAEQLVLIADLLWADGDRAFEKAADWADLGLVQGGSTGGSGGDPANPTEAAALGELEEGSRDRLAHYDEYLRFDRSHMEMSAGRLLEILQDVTTVISKSPDDPHTTMVRDKITGRENRVPVCAEYFCEAGAEHPKFGRCEACNRWIERWLQKHPGATRADCPIIPLEVINKRAVSKKRQLVT